MIRNPLNSFAVLFDGHADGQWSLPDPVIEARDALVRVHGLLERVSQAPEHPVNVRDRLAFLIATGSDVDAGPVLDAERAMAEHTECVVLTQAARDIASNNLNSALTDHAQRTITDHLAPAFAELVDGLRRDYGIAGHIDSNSPPAVVLSQPKPVRDALIRIDTNVNRYVVLRQAFHALRRVTDAGANPLDNTSYFAEIKNTETVWPAITSQTVPTDVPWPSQDRDRLGWLFAHGAELWMPTLQQQDDRYYQVFGTRLEQLRAARTNGNAMRHMFEGAGNGGDHPVVTRGAGAAERDAAFHKRLFGTAAGDVPVNGGPVESA